MLELFAVTFSTFQLLLEVPITSCTAQPQPRSALYFISLIKFLNLAGVLELFAVTSSTFQSLLQVPITTPAQLKLIQDHLFVLFLWLNPWTWQDCFNIWWLHPWHSNYCFSSRPQLEPQVLQTPTRHAQCITGSGWCCLWADYWSSSQNRTTESRAKLTRRSCIPLQASASAKSWCSALAGTGKGPAKQQLINLM